MGTAIIGTDGFFVGATPSRLLTSENSGFATIMPTAFAVSIDDPPPIATRQSAPQDLNAATPACTFSIVGLALTSEKISKSMSAPFKTSVTFAETPNLIRSGSDTTSAFLKPLAFISSGIAFTAPAP